MTTLHELAEEYITLLELAEDPETDPDMLRDTMEGISGAIEDKAQNYAIVMMELQNSADAMDAEIKRLKERKSAFENNAKRMKAVLQAAMEATGKTKFKTDLFSFGISKNPSSVVVDVPWTELPEDYLRYKDPEIDKAKIKKDILAGIDIGVAHLEQTSSLKIR